jgi:hypothetical protein
MLYQTPVQARNTKYLFVSCIIAFVAYSCKKEYTKFPYNDIEKFTITDNTGAELKAAIQDNKIIIYYPPFQTVPDSIKPQITVSTGASVSPLSGAKQPFKAGLKYTVTAEDGSTKTYELQAAINQPPITFTTGNTTLGSTLSLRGEYFIPDTTNTKIYLIATNKKETQIPGKLLSKVTASVLTFSLPASLGIDTGQYMVKLISGKRTATQGPIVLTEAFQKFSYPNITSIKRGDEYSVTDTSGYAMIVRRYGPNINRGLKLYINNTTYVPVTLTKLTGDVCTFRIPADCPLGFFQAVYSTNENGSNQLIFSLGAAKRVTVTQ